MTNRMTNRQINSGDEMKMKNQRLTKEDLSKLYMACNRIRSLASLENASFSANEEEDTEVKTAIRPYMMWFEGLANSVEDLLDGKEVDCLYFR